MTGFTSPLRPFASTIHRRRIARQEPMAEEFTPDICVIGGGPGGIALAVAAANRDVPVVLVEKDRLGGANLREGGGPDQGAARRGKPIRDASPRPGARRHRRAAPGQSRPGSTSMSARSIDAVAANVSAERLAALGVTVIVAKAASSTAGPSSRARPQSGRGASSSPPGSVLAPPPLRRARRRRALDPRRLLLDDVAQAGPSHRPRRRPARPRTRPGL